MLMEEEKIIKETLESVNDFLNGNEKIQKIMLKERFDFKTNDDFNIKNLVGFKNKMNEFFLMDRQMTRVIYKGEIDESKAIAKFDLRLLKTAFDLGMDEIWFFKLEKDTSGFKKDDISPCICTDGIYNLVVAPKFLDEEERDKHE